MPSFQEYLANGQAWLFVPAAILLGALHGLEPGHSKTMMAAFIVAIRGTVRQAVLLGLAATVSHTMVIWALAYAGLHFAGKFNAEETEPYFQLTAGVIVVAMAAWMFVRTGREAPGHHHHENEQPRGPHEGVLLDTGAGFVEVSVFETNVSPHFRLHFFDRNQLPVPAPQHSTVSLETLRTDSSSQTFVLAPELDFLRTTADLPEPHEFRLLLKFSDGGQEKSYTTEFTEHHHLHAHDTTDEEFQDAHEREHAAEITKRFASGNVTTGQLMLFGLTGGLLPCPSAFAVLMICLQLKEFTLGFALVLAFSFGLAITLVSVGTLAALSVKHASKHFKGFGTFARRAPYLSSIILVLIGCLMGFQGLRHLIK